MELSPFARTVLTVVRRIPVGHVATYGDVAEAAGRPGAARAVGNIMRQCGRPDIPCHRVIAAAGKLGGYGGKPRLERAPFRAGRLHGKNHTNRKFSTHKARPSVP